MINNVSQQILRKQRAKQWVKSILFIVLLAAFLVGAIALSVKTADRAYATTYNDMTFVTSGTDGTLTYYTGSSQGTDQVNKTGLYYWTFDYPVNSTIGYFDYVSGSGQGTSSHRFVVGDLIYNNIYAVSSSTLSVSAYAKVESEGVTVYMESCPDSTPLTETSNSRMLGKYIAASVSLPEDPTAPEGQHFAGWYYDEALTDPYEEGDVITEDTALYAKFEVNAYTITYMINGSVYSSSEVAYGEAASNVAVSVTTGREFSGWCTDSACTTAYDFENSSVTENITLYSTLENIKCTVTFYVDGEVYTTLEVPYGSTLIEFAASTAEGAATAASIIDVFNLSPEASSVITENTEITAAMKESLLKWNDFGVWMGANWPWIVGTVGVLLVIGIGAGILAKKRS